jgi:hypothetical protein
MKKVNEKSFLLLRDELLKQIQQRDSQILSLQSKEKELKEEIASLKASNGWSEEDMISFGNNVFSKAVQYAKKFGHWAGTVALLTEYKKQKGI